MQRHLPPALALTSAQGLGCGVAGQAWLLAGSSFCCVVLLCRFIVWLVSR